MLPSYIIPFDENKIIHHLINVCNLKNNLHKSLQDDKRLKTNFKICVSWLFFILKIDIPASPLNPKISKHRLWRQPQQHPAPSSPRPSPPGPPGGPLGSTLDSVHSQTATSLGFWAAACGRPLTAAEPHCCTSGAPQLRRRFSCRPLVSAVRVRTAHTQFRPPCRLL